MNGVDADLVRVRAAWDESRFALGIGPDDAAFADLCARHREAHRHYHDLTHVSACLAELEGLRALASRPAEVVTALLFHDAIYVPLASDNESRSAELCAEVLSRAGADPAAIERVRAAILATRAHDAMAEGDGDVALVCDVDLSILAAPRETFDAYELGVRREHAMIPDEAFARGRSAFVRGLAQRPRLFGTPALHARWDQPARANLERSLVRWRPVV